MTVEFGSVHALDICHARRIRTGMLDSQRIFKYVGPLAQIIDKEMRSGIASAFVVREPILEFVIAQHIDWLSTAPAMVFQMNIFHVPIGSQCYAANDFVTDCDRTLDGFQNRSGFCK